MRPPRAARPFSVGVNYWPRRSGAAMWRRFDAGEIAEDFARIAALGFDTVRVFVRWDDFQPAPDGADPTMLDRLARLVALASDRGLATMPVLFSGHLNGINYLPAWAIDERVPAGRFRTIVGDRLSPFGAGDLYRGPLLEAALVFARAAGERLRDAGTGSGARPALVAWDLGNAFDRVRELSHVKRSTGDHSSEPADERVVADWARRLTRELHAASGRPSTAGTFFEDLTRDRAVRFGTLCAPFAFASMQGDTVNLPFARGRLDPEAVPFLAMLTAGFSHLPVMVTGFGNPTCPGDKFSAFERFALPEEPPNVTISPVDTAFATYPCLTEHELARYATEVLERLHADGRLGAFWWCWSDAAEERHAEPPLDREPHLATYGLLRADGSEKPVAAALSAFARERREVTEPRDMTAIASAYYFRTLPTSTKTLYDAFLRFVEERRTIVAPRRTEPP